MKTELPRGAMPGEPRQATARKSPAGRQTIAGRSNAGLAGEDTTRPGRDGRGLGFSGEPDVRLGGRSETLNVRTPIIERPFLLSLRDSICLRANRPTVETVGYSLSPLRGCSSQRYTLSFDAPLALSFDRS